MSATGTRITVTKSALLPDPVKLARYAKAPELGPRILFFSGGTALRPLSQKLIEFTHNSIHFITPFDSGGSSAVLRKAFAMPAIGDIRNRLMALADQSLHGAPEIYELFALRLPKEADPGALNDLLQSLIRGKHPLVAAIPDPMRKIIRNHLGRFAEAMPTDFDLRGASIGNLILTAGYLDYRRQLDPVIFLFANLVRVRGVVRPVLNKDLQLAVRLDDGSTVVGQHRITGKETAPLNTKIRSAWICASSEELAPLRVPVRNKVMEQIQQAELICYPIGSFYSSLIANLLPGGIGRAIASTPCPKVFIPNTSGDPELHGQDVMEQVRTILYTLQRDFPEPLPTRDLLNFVLIDHDLTLYPGGVPRHSLEKMGLTVIAGDLTTEQSRPLLDATRLTEALLSLT